MASFATIDRSLSDSVSDLHDFLWAGAKHDQATLLRRLSDGASRLDAQLKARGAIARAVRPLVRSFDPRATGSDLFSFLYIVSGVAGAKARERRDPKEATRRASEVVVSNSIHLASAAGRFEIVEAFESGKSDFLSFQESLADILEARGVLPAHDLQRAANLTYNLHATWDASRPKDAQVLAATGAIGNAVLHSSLFGEALRPLGRYRDPPYGSLAPSLRRILENVGAHA
ncbi:MAG TPA: hypothetical protein VJ300_03565 [Thermoplasmata archaeon]|nr:hypothetical protein [Thermoplasmata archaeon]